MALLYDSNSLIEGLRTKYLENINDSIGERVIGSKNKVSNKKKRFGSSENVIDHKKIVSFYLSEEDSMSSFKEDEVFDEDKSVDIVSQGYDMERSIKRKQRYANESLSILSEKNASNIGESDSDDLELCFLKYLSKEKVKLKSKSMDIFRRDSKEDLTAIMKNQCLISGSESKHMSRQYKAQSRELKNNELTISCSNDVLSKSLESIYRNDMSYNPYSSYMEEGCLNFSRKSYPFCQSSSHKRSSLLTILIKTGMKIQTNPLADIFACFSGKGDLNPLKLKIYRPSGKDPKRPVSVVIKRIATVSDVIGFSLYCYIEQKMEPRLTSEQLNPNMWTLRIVEEDGELDHDFPALDRTRFLSKFGFDEFALVEATSTQFLENEKLTPFNFKINIDHFNS
ncbi:hypothetical protein PNEG_00195 [Pneumocystis murina B123]|uniref:CRIM domain-containing protein n=1 Tax=Pneumocystis murina (strain B123) TaxID=1069680 RepID=M7NSQ0_PNEMU|nr:hypothetical protein PNEG_00195 [Pneumocystis murina B123]EMR11763.1 hypothetical protein PNEG_00195 [Pneumocystis murina B123]